MSAESSIELSKLWQRIGGLPLTIREVRVAPLMWTYYNPGDGRAFGFDALIEKALRYQALGFDTFK